MSSSWKPVPANLHGDMPKRLIQQHYENLKPFSTQNLKTAAVASFLMTRFTCSSWNTERIQTRPRLDTPTILVHSRTQSNMGSIQGQNVRGSPMPLQANVATNMLVQASLPRLRLLPYTTLTAVRNGPLNKPDYTISLKGQILISIRWYHGCFYALSDLNR